jgi:hypothetical protein
MSMQGKGKRMLKFIYSARRGFTSELDLHARSKPRLRVAIFVQYASIASLPSTYKSFPAISLLKTSRMLLYRPPSRRFTVSQP